MTPHLRIARPVRDLRRSAAMYSQRLDLRVLGNFSDHDGFDGWDLQGATFADPDGYRTVLQRAEWRNASLP